MNETPSFEQLQERYTAVIEKLSPLRTQYQAQALAFFQRLDFQRYRNVELRGVDKIYTLPISNSTSFADLIESIYDMELLFPECHRFIKDAYARICLHDEPEANKDMLRTMRKTLQEWIAEIDAHEKKYIRFYHKQEKSSQECIAKIFIEKAEEKPGILEWVTTLTTPKAARSLVSASMHADLRQHVVDQRKELERLFDECIADVRGHNLNFWTKLESSTLPYAAKIKKMSEYCLTYGKLTSLLNQLEVCSKLIRDCLTLDQFASQRENIKAIYDSFLGMKVKLSTKIADFHQPMLWLAQAYKKHENTLEPKLRHFMEPWLVSGHPDPITASVNILETYFGPVIVAGESAFSKSSNN